ncbi:SnoaL-like protein [Herbihabitans rhizosphaerae]|uniref:SnoaL-like protein n=1 Tax=Herbihabitans rhizosphaerae TaxID=1872711 RepID=A0A4Q7KJS7_9PSEU|nr:nuclear transport factor 2 family protein [Herbihabitans rhizosphaerae]RZS36446.1 SnoaL-like protein [Herbihabitans rhizosphaerae]
MNTAERFRAAVEAGDLVAGTDLFAEDIGFYSPVKYKPFEGIEVVRALFRVLQRTFVDFRYVGEYAGSEVDGHVLRFRTVVDGKQVDGIDLIQADDSGRIATFTVMIRPLSSLLVVSEAIQRGLVEDGVLRS